MSEAISFFSESDMVVTSNGTKKISSEYPMWYNRQMMDQLQEDVSMAEFELKSGRVAESQLPAARQRLAKLQKQMEEVESSMPKMDDQTKDKISKVRKSLGKEIAALMYSRSDDKKGLVDVHNEVRKMESPTITVTSEIGELARACNVTPIGGKISRTQAEKIWKITSRALDENSNTESLRRE